MASEELRIKDSKIGEKSDILPISELISHPKKRSTVCHRVTWNVPKITVIISATATKKTAINISQYWSV